MSRTVLVTGATGFVMANLVRHLAERGHDAGGADLKPPDLPLRRFLENLPGSVTYRQVDATDRAAVAVLLQDVRPARAVHGAAITSIPPEVERAVRRDRQRHGNSERAGSPRTRVSQRYIEWLRQYA